ncbi:MAG: protein kinase [Myxococcota bacterium]
MARAEALAVAITAISCLQAWPAVAQDEPLAEAPSEAQALAETPRVAVAPATFPAELGFAREPLAEHVRILLREAAVEVAPAAQLRTRIAAAGPSDVATSCALVALAAADGASPVVLADLRATERGIDVALRVYEPTACTLESAARASGGAKTLGAALDASLARVLPALGGSADLLPAASLGLSQLAAESRALALLEEAELARAWRALEGDTSLLATALRSRIGAIAASREAPLAERVRLNTARGETAPNDVLARQILIQAARALDGEPADARVLLAAGELQLGRGEAGEARRYLEKAAALAPGNPDVHQNLGRAFAQLGDDVGARASFERAAQLEPDSSRALEELAQLEAHEPARQAAVLLRAGERAVGAYDERAAERAFAKVLLLDPHSVPAVKDRAAVLYARFGDAERARATWQEAIDAGGSSPARVLGAAQASHALGDRGAAETGFRTALELDPTSVGAALALGTLYTEMGRFDEARPWLEKAVALAPRDPEPKRGLAVVLHQAGQSDAALELLRAAERANGPTTSVLRMRATILRAGGDPAGALAVLERAIELDPVDAGLRAELAEAHELLGDPSAAERARGHATLLTPARPPPPEDAATATAESSGASASELGDVDERLAELIQSFVAVEADTGRVALIGVRERNDFLENPLACLKAPLQCLKPRVPNRDALDRALGRAIGGQYALIPRGEIEEGMKNSANRSLIAGLLAFERQDSLDANALSDMNLALGSDALFLARIERTPGGATAESASRCGGETPWRLELRQLAGRSPVTTKILGNALCIDARGEYSRWNRLLLGLLGAAGLALAFQLVRGWGSVSVTVNLPPQTRALFSISLSRRPRKARGAKSQKNKERAKSLIEDGLRRLNRYERALRQGSPVDFTWIPARRRSYYVTVRGPLINSATGELIGDFLEEQLVRVRRGKAEGVKFDLRPKETVLEITVSGADKAVGAVALALRGVPSSLRYANDGGVFLYLQPGKHTLLVGAGDRLLEKLFEIRSYDTMRMQIEIPRVQEWLFTGCPAAVTAYLEGDVPRAADELERAGETKAANKLRARLVRAQGKTEVAQSAPATPSDPRAAAELAESARDPHSAAALFEAAGEFADAADAHRAAGDLAAAARAYERAGDLASAIECAQRMPDEEYLLALYEKHGDSFEAGELAKRARQTLRAIHAFSQVDRIDSNYRKACQRLVELHSERNQFAPALEKLEELVELEGGEQAPLQLRSLLARLLETLGRGVDALTVWESIESRDAAFQDASARVAGLRAKHRPQPAPAASAPASAPAAGESRYEILEELGRGAMGVVYKARDTRLGRVVALKRLTDNLRGHPTAIAFFEREARSAAALSHPNIVVVYDAGQENGHYFITMEHLQGTTLEQILKQRGAMSAQIVASLGVQVCAGLHYAHTNKIIHRDIKTANLFFTRERIVKIMDFGLAKMVEEVRKGATMISGTPYYMAPEQALGENVDHRADLYALGVTFWNLLTNAFPFETGDVTFHHRNTPAPDVRTRAPGAPAELALLVAKLLAKRPDARFQNAAEVAQLLQQIAAAAPAP